MPGGCCAGAAGHCDAAGMARGERAADLSCVLVASVFFRAPSVAAALAMLAGMGGLHGAGDAAAGGGDGDGAGRGRLGARARRGGDGWSALFVIVWFMPNTQQIFAGARPVLDRIAPGRAGLAAWRPSRPAGRWRLGLRGVIAVLSMGGSGEFLYFRF